MPAFELEKCMDWERYSSRYFGAGDPALFVVAQRGVVRLSSQYCGFCAAFQVDPTVARLLAAELRAAADAADAAEAREAA